ncbi:hypothetical protein [Lysobacter enzymogenes]|uniref:hypothetical protein n=1 Tax=Lysobacter enzymogenes TaxID=69 RepID=UPI002264146B|nr:hypothetical protein [Lysobacter enzymogenes]UZW60915.1 hypothetical protein BV903_001095 [Lysobacter enzymogenes]
MLGNAASQSTAMAIGAQDSFDWRSVAVSAVSANVGRWVGNKVAAFGDYRDWSESSIYRAADFSAGFASRVTDAAARGNLSSRVLLTLGLDAFATTVGNAIVDAAWRRRPDDALAMGGVSNSDGSGDTASAYFAPRASGADGEIATLDRVTATAYGSDWQFWARNIHSNGLINVTNGGEFDQHDSHYDVRMPVSVPDPALATSGNLPLSQRPIYDVVEDGAGWVLSGTVPAAVHMRNNKHVSASTSASGTVTGLGKGCWT